MNMLEYRSSALPSETTRYHTHRIPNTYLWYPRLPATVPMVSRYHWTSKMRLVLAAVLDENLKARKHRWLKDRYSRISFHRDHLSSPASGFQAPLHSTHFRLLNSDDRLVSYIRSLAHALARIQVHEQKQQIAQPNTSINHVSVGTILNIKISRRFIPLST